MAEVRDHYVTDERFFHGVEFLRGRLDGEVRARAFDLPAPEARLSKIISLMQQARAVTRTIQRIKPSLRQLASLRRSTDNGAAA